MSAELVFVDTNVLVYARASREPKKQQRADEWLDHPWRHRTGRRSLQVLQEYYVSVTQKLKPGWSETQRDAPSAISGTGFPIEFRRAAGGGLDAAGGRQFGDVRASSPFRTAPRKKAGERGRPHSLRLQGSPS
jgi:hypothetical protein